MHQASNTQPDTVKSAPLIGDNPNNYVSPPLPSSIHARITTSNDQLFFIAYTPSGTMTKRWYLVQMDLEATASIVKPTLCEGEYYCTFLAKHPSNTKLSDDCSRWWPNWYRYSRDSVTDDIVFGDLILFHPNITPNHTKFIQWGNTVGLTSCR